MNSGSEETRQWAAWLTGAAQVKSNRQIKAMVYFDANGTNSSGDRFFYRLGKQSAALTTFADLLREPTSAQCHPMTRDGDSGPVGGAAGENGMTVPIAPADPSGARPDAGTGAEGDAQVADAVSAGSRGRGRAAYLSEVSLQLWPDPAQVSTSGGDHDWVGPLKKAAGGAGGDLRPKLPADLRTVSEFVVLPGLRRPRLLVPVARRPAATALRRYGKPSSLKTRLGTQGLSYVFRSGLGFVMLRDRLLVRAPAGAPTIESYLSTALGLDVIVSLYLGSARANRKPVLQLLTSRGDTFGYAKVGVNELHEDVGEGGARTLRRTSATRRWRL